LTPIAGRLYGSGLIVVNPPFTLESELNAILPALAKLLEQGSGGSRVEWIRGES
jgi:23S rRNA (adenine2030-N6)-methyltransferase